MTQVDTIKPNVKPTFFKCLGTGLKRDLKNLVPVLGTCVAGDDFVKQNQINECVKDIKTYGYVDSKKSGEKASIGKRFMSGVAGSALAFPFAGTYALGKYKVQHENLKADVENLKYGDKDEKAKKPGIVKTYFIGLLEKTKRCIPFLSAYTYGKNMIELDNMKNDIAKLSR